MCGNCYSEAIMPAEISSQTARYHAIRNVTLIGVVVNLLLAFIKIIFGWIGQSQALLIDGIHSMSDLISDGVILFAARYSSQKADAEHPYGHGRFETLATVFIGIALLMVAFGIFIEVIQRLLQPETRWIPTAVALLIAAISIIAKEILYHYTLLVAKRVGSQMLKANAWHHRSDAVSSIVVFVGVAGSLVGMAWLDTIAALIVVLMIGQIGWSLSWENEKSWPNW